MSSRGKAPERTRQTSSGTEGAARAELEEMLKRFESTVGVVLPQQGAPSHEAVDEVSEHIETLRTTIGTQKQAQRLLSLAIKMRNDAAAEGERILIEAKTASQRLREETETRTSTARDELAAWVDERRTTVESTVAELFDSANRETEEIRAGALRSALAAAEQEAQEYASRTQAMAEQDADAVRQEARDVLDRAAEVVIGAQETMHGFADAMTSQMSALEQQTDLTRAMLEELTDPEG